MTRRIVITSASVVATLLIVLATRCNHEPGTTQPPRAKLRVFAIFATPLEEPWDHAVHQALQRAEKELDIEYAYTDNVQPTQFEKTLRDTAAQHYDIIFGDAFAAEEIVRRVARDFPETHFVFGSGLGPSEPNLSVFDDWIHEPAYLAGMLAGRVSKTNTIGVVGGFAIPEVNRLVNAFKAGALEVNPKAKLKVTFIGSWFDPPKAKEATNALISQGADVIYGERAGVIEECAEKHIPVIGNLVDQHNQAPETVVTSVVWDMWPTVKYVIDGVRAKTFQAQNLAEWSMMAKGGARLAPFYVWQQRIDKSIPDLIARRSDEILTGRFRVPVIESEPKSD